MCMHVFLSMPEYFFLYVCVVCVCKIEHITCGTTVLIIYCFECVQIHKTCALLNYQMPCDCDHEKTAL